LWLISFATVRSILDDFWVPAYRTAQYWTLSFFNTLIYIYTLYLIIPALAIFFLEKIYSQKADNSEILQKSVLIWVVYPFVTIISLITNSPPTQTIPLFKHIPTFMVDRNFLPLGMIAVIPVLIVFYTWILSRHSKINMAQALISVLMSLVVIYLTYYQYTLAAFFHFAGLCGSFCSYGFYNICFLSRSFHYRASSR
jgi:hypothetical protein